MSTGRAATEAVRPMAPRAELVLVLAGIALALMLVLQPMFLTLAAAGILALVATFKFDLFMYSMVLIMPWYPFLEAKLPVTDIMLVLRFVMFGGVWIRLHHNGQSASQWLWGSKLRKAVLLFAGIALFSLVISSMRSNVESYRAVRRLFSYLLVFYAVLGWANSREKLTQVVKVTLYSLFFVAIFGFYQFVSGGYSDLYMRLYPFQEDVVEPWTGRITSFFYHYNSLAGYLNLVLPLALGAMITARERSLKWTGFFALSFGAAALVLTGSRGGMLAAIGVLVLAAWKLVPRSRNAFLILGSVALAVCLVFVLREGQAGTGGEAIQRLENVDEFTQLSRFAVWGAAILMFRANMWIGVGYGNYRYLYNDYVPAIPGGQLDAHNLYLQFLAETGLIGFIAFFVMLNGFFRRSYKMARIHDPVHRMVGIGVCGAIIGTLIHGTVDFLFIVSPQFGSTFWMVLGLGLCSFEMHREEEAAGWQAAA